MVCTCSVGTFSTKPQIQSQKVFGQCYKRRLGYSQPGEYALVYAVLRSRERFDLKPLSLDASRIFGGGFHGRVDPGVFWLVSWLVSRRSIGVASWGRPKGPFPSNF